MRRWTYFKNLFLKIELNSWEFDAHYILIKYEMNWYILKQKLNISHTLSLL